MKKSIWIVVRCVAFFLVLFVIVYHVSWHFGVDDPRSYEAEVNYTLEKPQSLDAVYLGGSDVFEFYQPLFGWSEYGIAVWNYAINSAPVLAIQHYLIEARKTQPNALFIISLNPFKRVSSNVNTARIHHSVDYMPLSVNKIQMTNTLTENLEGTFAEKLEYYLSIIRFHSRWNELYPWIFGTTDKDYKSSSYRGGFLNTVFDTSNKLILSEKRKSLPEGNYAAFINLLDYCDKNQLKVLFIVSPQCMNQTELGHINVLVDTVRSRNYPCLDLLHDYNKLGLDLETDYYDSKHTNIHGSLKYSHYLGAYLVENYGFEDKRGQEQWESWDQSAAVYNKTMSNWALKFELEHKPRTDLDAPKLLRSAVKEQSIKIVWEPVEGADGYDVYRKSRKPWTLIKSYDKETVDHTDSKLAASTKYTYTVVAYHMVDGVKQYGRFDVKGISKTTGGRN